MASKRMFFKDVVRSDKFLELTTSSRELYFQLCLDADDDGFIQNVKTISRILETTQTDIENLTKQGFLLDLGDNIFLITHWYIHNTVRKDRKQNTIYQTKLQLVKLDEDKKYILRNESNESNNNNNNNELASLNL